MATAESGEHASGLLAGRRWLRRGEILLLAGFAVGIWAASLLLFQPRFEERAGPDALPHLSTEPLPFQAVVWGDDATGPGATFAQGESLLLATSVVLLLLMGAAGGLGHIAVAGVVAAARRFELRLRRAVGASRNRILGDLARDAMGIQARGALIGSGIAVAGALVLAMAWTLGPALPTPVAPIGAAVVASVVAVFLLHAGFSFAVVQTGEAVPGAPLHPDTPLGEPFRGEVSHPGVPVLQIAVATLILACGGFQALGTGPGLEGSQGATHSGMERLVLEAHSRTGVPAGTGHEAGTGREAPTRRDAVTDLLVRLGELQAAGLVGAVSLSSAGFWEGAGHVRYAETECGYCFRPGSPPVLAPLKGEPAVHHAVSPDTFDLAGIVLLEGRGFTAEDGPATEPVAVVSRRFAQENFQDGEAIGRRVRIGAERTRWHRVVGVIEPLPRGDPASRRNPPEDVLVAVAQVQPVHVELVAAGLAPLVDGGTVPGYRTLEHAPFPERAAAIRAWADGFGRLWFVAGVAAGLLALLGTLLTVGRRVGEEAPEIALRRALGASRPRLLVRYLGLGLGLGAVGTLLGSWLALFAVSALFPEGFQAPATLAEVLFPIGLLLTVTAGIVSAGAARASMSGPPRAGMEG